MEMNLDRLIKMVYDEMIASEADLFVKTEEFKAIDDEFFNRVIQAEYNKNHDAAVKLESMYGDVICGYEMSGFSAGMKVGMALASDMNSKLKAVKI